MFNLFVVITIIVITGCNPQSKSPTKEVIEEKSVEELVKEFEEEMKKESDSDNAMTAEEQLNYRIEMIKSRMSKGMISQEEAGELIQRTKRRIKNNANNEIESEIPIWLSDLGFSSPIGLKYVEDKSFITEESDERYGYNSVFLIYNGNYSTAMKEALRIARDAEIPLSESCQKAKDIADQLGHAIEGVKGVTYMNYKFGDRNFSKKYKISISVDESGNLKIRVVDEETKNITKAYVPLKK
jgi:hypothetical protein